MIAWLIILWLTCGVIAAGFMNPMWRVEFKTIDSPRERRNDLAFTLGICLLGGVISLIVVPFETGFCQYGWSLSCKWEERT